MPIIAPQPGKPVEPDPGAKKKQQPKTKEISPRRSEFPTDYGGVTRSGERGLMADQAVMAQVSRQSAFLFADLQLHTLMPWAPKPWNV
jgi:hypothetical protein